MAISAASVKQRLQSLPEKIAAAYDQATPASLHLNQTGNDRLGAAVAALL